MKKSELVHFVAKKTGITIKDTEAVVSVLFETVVDQLAKNEKVKIMGFGTFEARKSAERAGRNPKTGEKVIVSPRVIAKFKAGKRLKEKLNS